MALHAEGDGREAIAAAPEPDAAALLTVHAWPGADELRTWEQREIPAGPCRGQRKVGGAAPHSHVVGEEGVGWGWYQLGMGSE